MEIIDNTKPFIEYVKEAYMNKKVNRNNINIYFDTFLSYLHSDVNIPESSLNVIRQIKNESYSSSDSQKENILLVFKWILFPLNPIAIKRLKYISSNKQSEITEVTTKNSIEEGIDEEVFNFLYENLISNSKEEIVKHMKEFAIYIRDNILI